VLDGSHLADQFIGNKVGVKERLPSISCCHRPIESKTTSKPWPDNDAYVVVREECFPRVILSEAGCQDGASKDQHQGAQYSSEPA
jgi:hypothetical protein